MGDGEGHALRGATGRGDLAERHHGGGDEARGQVRCVCGEEKRGLMG